MNSVFIVIPYENIIFVIFGCWIMPEKFSVFRKKWRLLRLRGLHQRAAAPDSSASAYAHSQLLFSSWKRSPRAINIRVSMQRCKWVTWCWLACKWDAAADQAATVLLHSNFSRSYCYTVSSAVGISSGFPSARPSLRQSAAHVIAHYLLLRTWQDRHRKLCSSRLSGLSLDPFIKSEWQNLIAQLYHHHHHRFYFRQQGP